MAGDSDASDSYMCVRRFSVRVRATLGAPVDDRNEWIKECDQLCLKKMLFLS